jgi:hypothetical protein
MILQMKRRKNGAYAPILLSTKARHVALHFAPAYLFLYQTTTAPSWVTRIDHKEDNIGKADYFVQHAV